MDMKNLKHDYYSHMLSKSRSFIYAAVLAMGVYGCSTALYKPLPEHATAMVSHDQLLKGRVLYVSKCGSCHTLYKPHQYTEQVWIHNLDEMQERAKMNDVDKLLILEYLKHAPENGSK